MPGRIEDACALCDVIDPYRFGRLFFIIQGSTHPSKYQEVLSENVSAVQVTQVYTEAMFRIVVGIGIVSIAVLVAVIGILFHASKPLSPDPSSTDTLET